MPYSNIEAIMYSTGLLAAGFRITGRGSMHFRIENVQPKDTVKPFADLVRSRLPSSQASPSAPASPASVADEIQKFADLLEQGYLTQDEFNTKKKELLHYSPQEVHNGLYRRSTHQIIRIFPKTTTPTDRRSHQARACPPVHRHARIFHLRTDRGCPGVRGGHRNQETTTH